MVVKYAGGRENRGPEVDFGEIDLRAAVA